MIPLELRLVNFMDIVTFISDKEFQRDVWVKKMKNLTSIDSMEELYCQFYDDNAIDDFIEHELPTSPLNESQRNAILQFRDAMNAYSLVAFRKVNGKELLIKQESDLINEPEWDNLVRLAVLTKNVFPDVAPEYSFPKKQS